VGLQAPFGFENDIFKITRKRSTSMKHAVGLRAAQMAGMHSETWGESGRLPDHGVGASYPEDVGDTATAARRIIFES